MSITVVSRPHISPPISGYHFHHTAQQNSLNNGLVSWWKVMPGWRGGTMWRDLVGNNHATISNATATTLWSPISPIGGSGSLLLDGSNDVVEIPNYLLGAPNSIIPGLTVSAWLRPGAGFTSNYRRYFSIQNVSGGNNYITCHTLPTFDGPAGELRVHIHGTSTNTSGFALAADTWYHIINTFNDATNTVCIYRNGVPIRQNTGVANQMTNDQFIITGSLNAGETGHGWLGHLDDIRLYRRALTDGEALNLYQETLRNSLYCTGGE